MAPWDHFVGGQYPTDQSLALPANHMDLAPRFFAPPPFSNAQRKGTYARMGMSGSTSEMEDLAAAQAASSGATANARTTAINTGLNAARTGLTSLQLAGGEADNLLLQAMTQDQALSEAIQRLAALTFSAA